MILALILAAVQSYYPHEATLKAPAADPPYYMIAYTATWCPNCTKMKPYIVSAQKHGYNLVVADVDLKSSDTLPGRNSRNEIPFFVVVDRITKKVVEVSEPGSMEPQEFKAFVRKYLRPLKTKEKR